MSSVASLDSSEPSSTTGSEGSTPPGPFAVPDLGRLTTAELAEGFSGDFVDGSDHPRCILIPLGATEQHGPHLPLATDSIIARHWALAAAGRVPGVVVAPTLPYGSSGEHQGFAGTISIGQAALRLLIVEIVRSASHDFDTVIFVSGHGGNQPMLSQAVAQMQKEGHRVDWLTPSWPKSTTVAPLDAHAGHTETSLMLYLEPDLVRPFDNVDGVQTAMSELMPTLRSEGLAAVTTSGILGDPRDASPEHGHLLFETLVNQLVAKVRSIMQAE